MRTAGDPIVHFDDLSVSHVALEVVDLAPKGIAVVIPARDNSSPQRGISIRRNYGAS